MGPWYSRQPWRNVEWNDSTRCHLKEFVREYRPTVKSIPQARILLVGDVGAGKSSFFNSINSIFSGYIIGQANAGTNDTSLILKYRTYKVRVGHSGRALPFLLGDTMGLEKRANEGVSVEDIDSILKGYIKDGYQFNPTKPWSQDGDQCHIPPFQERIHCVVFLIDASKLPLMNSAEDNSKFIQIRNKAKLLDVPVMVLLTKVDKVCPHVEKDLKNVYWSKYLKQQIDKACDFLGIQESNVFPVKNYCCENNLDMHCDILLLTAMQKMLCLADDFQKKTCV